MKENHPETDNKTLTEATASESKDLENLKDPQESTKSKAAENSEEPNDSSEDVTVVAESITIEETISSEDLTDTNDTDNPNSSNSSDSHSNSTDSAFDSATKAKDTATTEPKTTETTDHHAPHLDSTGKAYQTKTPSPKNYASVIASLALICSIASLGFTSASYMKQVGITVYNSTDGNSATFTDGSIADVASKVSPSVVSIVTETRTSSWYSSYSSSAAGTGFIVSDNGYIVTNKHVIDGARSVKVVLHDGTEYDDVKIVGADPLNDAAVLKINNVSGLPAVSLGNSKTITIGEQVLAVGNALGAYQNSVTFGIVSGTGRSLTATDSSGTNAETLSDMIQTDAAINGGNSGGPLVNAAGQVIGINTAYASDSNNIGFAIPITAVKGLIRDAINHDKVQRAVLGVRYLSLDPATAKEFDLKDITAGAYLYTGSNTQPAIIPDSAGAKAGLKEKDVIIAVNGTPIGSAGSLSTLIGEYSVGDTVQLTIYRDGKTTTLPVTLDAYAE